MNIFYQISDRTKRQKNRLLAEWRMYDALTQKHPDFIYWLPPAGTKSIENLEQIAGDFNLMRSIVSDWKERGYLEERQGGSNTDFLYKITRKGRDELSYFGRFARLIRALFQIRK